MLEHENNIFLTEMFSTDWWRWRLNAQPQLGDFDLQVTTDADCQCNKEKAHGQVLVVGL